MSEESDEISVPPKVSADKFSKQIISRVNEETDSLKRQSARSVRVDKNPSDDLQCFELLPEKLSCSWTSDYCTSSTIFSNNISNIELDEEISNDISLLSIDSPPVTKLSMLRYIDKKNELLLLLLDCEGVNIKSGRDVAWNYFHINTNDSLILQINSGCVFINNSNATIFKKDNESWTECSRLLDTGVYFLIISKTVHSFVLDETGCECVVDFVKISVPSGSVVGVVNFQLIIDNLIDYNDCLACDVIQIIPSYRFKNYISLYFEILHYNELAKNYSLNVYHWDSHIKKCLQHVIVRDNNKVYCRVSVRHFSFFKIVWKNIANGIECFKRIFSQPPPLPTISSDLKLMKCVVTMDENDTDRFGLELIVYDSMKPGPEVQNYSHIVGRSLSYNIKLGSQLIIKLKSKLFIPDLDAGEDDELTKSINFIGNDFNVSYALKFIECYGERKGPFGKVLICCGDSCENNNSLFEFNIQKGVMIKDKEQVKSGPGGRGAVLYSELCDDDDETWSVAPIKELATQLFITDDSNWVLFAKKLGFTNQEINSQFRGSLDPVLLMMEVYKTRGGTAREFINSMYEIYRENNVINPSPSSNNSNDNKSSNKSSGFGSFKPFQRIFNTTNSSNGGGISEGSVTSSSAFTVDSFFLSRRRKLPKVKRRQRRKILKRRHRSSSSSESSSSSSSSSDERNKKKKKVGDESLSSDLIMENDESPLTEAYFWRFSKSFTHTNWKAVGRTLKLDEATLVNIETQHTHNSLKELFYQMLLVWKENSPKSCTFGTLYKALVTEGMVNIARKMRSVAVD